MCKSVYVPACARHTHRSETPSNSFYFYMYISVKMVTIAGAINRFIPSGYVQPACRIPLGSKFTGLDLDLDNFDLGLDNAVFEHIPAVQLLSSYSKSSNCMCGDSQTADQSAHHCNGFSQKHESLVVHHENVCVQVSARLQFMRMYIFNSKFSFYITLLQDNFNYEFNKSKSCTILVWH